MYNSSITIANEFMQNYADWYQALEKPFFAPPEWLFGVAWGAIYPLIFIALILVVARYTKGYVEKTTLWLFFFNLIFNFAFSPIQFTLQNNILAAADILFVLGTLALLERRLWRESRVAFWLLVPYLLWGSFATILQLTITLMNI